MSVRTAGVPVEEAVDSLKRSPAVDVAEPDYLFHAAAIVPNDPGYAKQWYLSKIRLPEAWAFAKGSSVITVAVLDTGVDISHPDLKDRIWTNPGEVAFNGIDDDHNGYIDDVHGWNFVDNDNNPFPSLDGTLEEINHGTVVAGIIGAAGNNAEGITGINWNVNIMPVRVLDSNGNGSTSAIEAGIRYAVRNGAKVINLSFVGNEESQILRQAIENAWRAGVIVVAAAGNEGGTEGNLNAHPRYPVCTTSQFGQKIVIGVAATDENDRLAPFSNYGSDCIDVSAPGTNFYATQVYRPTIDGLKQPYGGGWTGSSVAAPVVSGLAALLKSILPDASASDIRDLIMLNTVPINGLNPGKEGQLGAGRVDALGSVMVAEDRALGILPGAGSAVPTPAPQAASDSLIAAAGGLAGYSQVRLFSAATKKETLGFAASADRSFSVRSLAAADLEGDGKNEIVVGAGRGSKPLVRVFTRDGLFIRQFYAFDQNFRGGVSVAAGALDSGGKGDIVVGAGPGGGPHVRVFSAVGREIGSFFAFPKRFRGGLNLAVADLNGDGKEEIVVGAGPGGGGEVRVFDPDGMLISRFNAFDHPYNGDTIVAAGDMDGSGASEIAVAGAGGISLFTAFGKRVSSWPIKAFAMDDLAIIHGGAGNPSHLLVAGRDARGQRLRVYGLGGTLVEDAALPGFLHGPALKVSSVR